MRMKMEELRSILTSSVEAVLGDAPALAAFTTWMAEDDDRYVQGLSLYTAIHEFQQKAVVHTGTSIVKLALSIHQKYVSLQTGSCHFLPNEVRQKQSALVHRVLGGVSPYPGLFDLVIPYLLRHFRSLHTQFVCSEAFYAHLTQATSAPKPKTRRNHFWNRNRSSTADTTKQSVISGETNANADGSHKHESEEARRAFADVLCSRLALLEGDAPREEPCLRRESDVEEVDEMKKAVDDVEGSDDDVEHYVDRLTLNENSHARSDLDEPSVNSPYGIGAFAPPPINSKSRYNFDTTDAPSGTTGNIHYCDGRGMMSDSSGFCSGASDFMSFDPISSSRYGGYSSSNTLSRSAHRQLPTNGFSTLPTRRREPPPPPTTTLTVEMRDEDGVPLVAKIPDRDLTFRGFRGLFGIAAFDKNRYFFKSTCEDGSAAFQYTLVWDDDDVLPVFQGRISAICKACIGN